MTLTNWTTAGAADSLFCIPGFDLRRPTVMLNVGDSAPDFTLLTHEGQPLSLSSLRGHKVLLWFYPKADTPG
jgi:hypothetical protein